MSRSTDRCAELEDRLSEEPLFDWSRSAERIRELTDPIPMAAIEVLSREYRDGSLRKMFEELSDLGLPFEADKHSNEAAERLARRRLVRMAEQVGVELAAVARHFERRPR